MHSTESRVQRIHQLLMYPVHTSTSALCGTGVYEPMRQCAFGDGSSNLWLSANNWGVSTTLPASHAKSLSYIKSMFHGELYA